MSTTTFTRDDYKRFADENEIDLAGVGEMPRDEFFELLNRIINDDDVPFPIPVEKRQPYLDACANGELFSIGGFTDLTVDLKHYANSQQYQQLSLIHI